MTVPYNESTVPGSIDDVEADLLLVDLGELLIGVFDGRVLAASVCAMCPRVGTRTIFFLESVLNELDRDGRLADTTITNNDLGGSWHETEGDESKESHTTL